MWERLKSGWAEMDWFLFKHGEKVTIAGFLLSPKLTLIVLACFFAREVWRLITQQVDMEIDRTKYNRSRYANSTVGAIYGMWLIIGFIGLSFCFPLTWIAQFKHIGPILAQIWYEFMFMWKEIFRILWSKF